MSSRPPLPRSVTPTVREADTLLPCPACRGSGRKTVDADGRTYVVTDCAYCKGGGMITKQELRAWQALSPAIREALRS